MDKKDFLQQKYCEINQLKNLLQTYPKEYCETIIKVMEKVFDEITEYLDEETSKLKTAVKKAQHQRVFTVDELAKDNDKNSEINSNSREELRYYKLEDISKFDGKNGSLAYVVINGTVYDVTSMRHWIEGNHYGLSAGRDLTEYFETCHKDEKDILKKLRIVGTIIE